MKKVLWGLGIVALLVVVLVATNLFSKQSGKGTAIKVVQTKQGHITKEVFANGKIESKDLKEQFPASSGLIAKIHVRKGDVVKKGQELLTLSTSDLETKLKEQKYQLQVNSAEKDKFLSDQAKARKQTFETAKKEMSEAGTSASLDSLDENHAADLQLYDLKIQEAQSNVEEIQAKLANNRLLAEIDGIVTAVAVKEGQEVTSATSAFTITNVAALQVKANFAENDANLAKTGLPVKVTGDAFLNAYKGKIASISPIAVPSELNAKENVVEFVVNLDETAAELRPGYKATVQLAVENEPHLIVPLSAVKRDGQQAYVFKVVDKKSVRTNVKLGAENDESVEVLEGLQADETIIEGPSADVKDGMQVEVK